MQLARIREVYIGNKRVYFFFNLVFLYAVWKVISYLVTEVPFFILYWGALSEFVVQRLIEGTLLFLKILGYTIFESGYRIGIAGTDGVLVAYGCTGIQLTILMGGLLLASPGKWFHKLWFICLGIFSIYLINVTRIGLLSIYVAEFPERDFFNHKTYFNFAVLLLMFLMWVVWIKYFSESDKISKP